MFYRNNRSIVSSVSLKLVKVLNIHHPFTSNIIFVDQINDIASVIEVYFSTTKVWLKEVFSYFIYDDVRYSNQCRHNGLSITYEINTRSHLMSCNHWQRHSSKKNVTVNEFTTNYSNFKNGIISPYP